MPEKNSSVKRHRWKLPLGVATAGLAAAFFFILYSPNFGDILAFLVLAPVAVTLGCLLIPGPWQVRRDRGAILASYVVVSCLLLIYRIEVREESRWLATSRIWKARVTDGSDSGRFAPVPDTDRFKVVGWDGWGMFAQNTEVYLVYDPQDDLRYYSSSALHGLPCPVWKVQRLERNWYSVTFFTSTSWAHPCS